MEAAFAAHALPAPPRAQIRRIVGLSLAEAIRRLSPDCDAETGASLVQAYKDAFRARRATGVLEEPLYDGIATLIADLDAAGWLLGVATGKSDRGLAHCLDRHGLTGQNTQQSCHDHATPHAQGSKSNIRDHLPVGQVGLDAVWSAENAGLRTSFALRSGRQQGSLTSGVKRKAGASLGIEGAAVLDHVIVEFAADNALWSDVERHCLDIGGGVAAGAKVERPVPVQTGGAMIVGL
eukprot:gene30457-39246_t